MPNSYVLVRVSRTRWRVCRYSDSPTVAVQDPGDRRRSRNIRAPQYETLTKPVSLPEALWLYDQYTQGKRDVLPMYPARKGAAA